MFRCRRPPYRCWRARQPGGSERRQARRDRHSVPRATCGSQASCRSAAIDARGAAQCGHWIKGKEPAGSWRALFDGGSRATTVDASSTNFSRYLEPASAFHALMEGAITFRRADYSNAVPRATTKGGITMRRLLLATAALALSSMTAAAADLPVQPQPQPYVEQEFYPQPPAYYAEPCPCPPPYYYAAPPYPTPFFYRGPIIYGRPFFYGRAFFGRPHHYW